MRARLLLAAVASLTLLAACSESPTSPSSTKAPSIRKDDGEGEGSTLECRSGYQLVSRSDGTTECVPIEP